MYKKLETVALKELLSTDWNVNQKIELDKALMEDDLDLINKILINYIESVIKAVNSDFKAQEYWLHKVGKDYVFYILPEKGAQFSIRVYSEDPASFFDYQRIAEMILNPDKRDLVIKSI